MTTEDKIIVTLGIIGQGLPILCMLLIPVFNRYIKSKCNMFKPGNSRTVNDK